MSKTDRVRILEAKYDGDKDLFIWRLHFLEGGTDQSFCWPSADLLSALGITGTPTPEMLHEFCSNMTGKEINFVVEGEPVSYEAGTQQEYESLTDGVSEHFDTFRNHVEGEGS